MVARAPGTHEAILEVTDALGDAGCSDASIRGHMDGMELLFEGRLIRYRRPLFPLSRMLKGPATEFPALNWNATTCRILWSMMCGGRAGDCGADRKPIEEAAYGYSK